MTAHCFSNRNDVNLLLIGTEENINLYRLYLAFYTLINYFRKLREFFFGCRLKQSLVGVSRKNLKSKI